MDSVPNIWQRADGPGVSFESIPYYVGPWQFLKKFWAVRSAVRNALQDHSAVIMRLDSQLAAFLFPLMVKSRRPYGAEVVVDPHDVFAPGSGHPFRPYFRWKFSRQLRMQCAEASAVAFVTECALQQRYPASKASFTTHYSSVELSSDSFISQPRLNFGVDGKFRIVSVGSMADLRKSQDVLIDAMAQCTTDGLNLELHLVGEGRYRSVLEERVRARGLTGRVVFLGQLSAGDVRAQLDQADLFVLVSRAEGLPRAAIEAMARGLPTIGSLVGGFPEIISREYLVPPGDVPALVRSIKAMLSSTHSMAALSCRNIHRASDFHDERLGARRREFYLHVRKQTEVWLQNRSS
jgi:glycosyltransferase involved in cell wall biosynthesis